MLDAYTGELRQIRDFETPAAGDRIIRWFTYLHFDSFDGILVLEARDMNHAVQLMAQHPALRHGSIFEIRPAGDMSEVIKASQQRRRQNTAC